LFELKSLLLHLSLRRVWHVKALSTAKGLGITLALAVLSVQAEATQWSGANSSHQSGTWTGSPLVERGNGVGGQPSQLAQSVPPVHSIIQAQSPSIHTGGPIGMDTGRGSGISHGTGFGHGRGHFHGHRHFIVVFVGGAPFWFPVYTDYPYGYVAPLDTSSAAVSDASDDGYVSSADSAGGDSGTSQETTAYSDLGWSWGQDLRREVATWDQFVAYLKTYIVTAPASAQADFRGAFINAYRLNGAAAYDKAAAEAAGFPPAPPTGPKIITYPPPPPGS
jgi:hypothetical protein